MKKMRLAIFTCIACLVAPITHAQTGKDYFPPPPPISWPRQQPDGSRQLADQYERTMRALEARDAVRPKPIQPRRRDEGPLPNRPADETEFRKQ